jgi:hypothetical protein
MSTGRRDEGGVPRSHRALVVPPGGASREENWHGADEARVDKLRHKSLQRRARACGLELRHSAYGYALIDSARKRVDERSDLSLDEIESVLERA